MLDIPLLEILRLAAQLGAGVFMGVILGAILYSIMKQMLTMQERQHTQNLEATTAATLVATETAKSAAEASVKAAAIVIETFKGEQQIERDRNDRNLTRFWDGLEKLTDGFELAKCRYNGPCQYQIPPPSLRHPPDSNGSVEAKQSIESEKTA